MVCERYQLGVIPCSPLANGFLTGRYWHGETTESARTSSVLRRYDCDDAWRTLEVVRSVAQETSSTPAAVALAWLLARPVIIAPIVGASSAVQLREQHAALDLALTPEQTARLNEVSAT